MAVTDQVWLGRVLTANRLGVAIRGTAGHPNSRLACVIDLNGSSGFLVTCANGRVEFVGVSE